MLARTPITTDLHESRVHEVGVSRDEREAGPVAAAQK